jgi:TolB-like protein
MKPAVPPELKRISLDKVAASRAFARAEQLRRLLLWLGGKALDGCAPPTEYEVARGALLKPEDYDPQTDSLVRKEMTRVRSKLRAYYGEEGTADSLRICNDDAYQLTFEFSGTASLPGPSAQTRGLLVLPFYAASQVAGQAEILYGELLLRLAGIPKLELVAQTTARKYAGRHGDIREFAAESGADLVIEATLRPRNDDLVFTIWLADGRTGRTRKPCRLQGSDPEVLAEEAFHSIQGLVV